MDDYVIIRNPVPTPEEMAKILGVSADRLEAIRAIMNGDPVPKKAVAPAPAAINSKAEKKKSARLVIDSKAAKKR